MTDMRKACKDHICTGSEILKKDSYILLPDDRNEHITSQTHILKAPTTVCSLKLLLLKNLIKYLIFLFG